METKKTLGIWLDHSTANLLDLNKENSNIIESEFTYDTKQEALSRSEDIMHNKEQQMQESFYKDIAEKILNYKHVLLFGPTNAKLELKNFLDKDSKFKDIQIDVEAADKMTDHERKTFVKNHFKN
ncbi:hypothetical protein [Pedobacter alpinus]|uniref:Host attachment protein n=1 Tax=Pedobacter alpinus TaxID=1590643 RepID=A0ABW5TRY7_9SPHI